MEKGKAIGIISFKGGVGKTVSAVNIASSLAKLKKSVALVDSSFSSPNLHIHLGLLKPNATLTDVMEEKAELEDATYIHETGMRVIPCSFPKNKLNMKKFKDKIKKLKNNYDFVVIDSSPTLNEEMASVLMSSDELLFVTTPDYPTLLATMKAAEISKEKNLNVRGIIINKKRGKKFELTKDDIEKVVNIPVIAELDDDIKMLEANSNFTPLVSFSPKNKNSKEYLKIASLISGEKIQKKDLNYFLGKMKGFFGNINFQKLNLHGILKR
jgi:septum site-determining protein MinD